MTKHVRNESSIAYMSVHYNCCFYSKTLIKLKVAHSNIIRQFYKLQGGQGTSISYHLVAMDIHKLEIIRRRLVCSLYSRVFSSQNCTVKSMVDAICFSKSVMFKEWLNVLFNGLFFAEGTFIFFLNLYVLISTRIYVLYSMDICID